MPETKFTRGPWVCQMQEGEGVRGGLFRIWANAFTSEAIVIAEGGAWWQYSDGAFPGLEAENAANAELLAAAPDLYAALLAWQIVEHHESQNAMYGADDVDHELTGEARIKAIGLTNAALAKARGEVPRV